jgi:hypothetical protein
LAHACTDRVSLDALDGIVDALVELYVDADDDDGFDALAGFLLERDDELRVSPWWSSSSPMISIKLSSSMSKSSCSLMNSSVRAEPVGACWSNLFLDREPPAPAPAPRLGRSDERDDVNVKARIF